MAGTARVALDAREGDARCCEPDGTRPPRDQRDRGHHRAQARRAGPALPRRGRPRARRLARLPGDAARRSPGSRSPTSRTGARSTRSSTASSSASRPPTPTRARSRRCSRSPSATRPTPTAETGLYGVLRSGALGAVRPRSATRCCEAAARDEEHLALLRSIGMTSAMVVPMLAHGTVVGVITFVSAETGHALRRRRPRRSPRASRSRAATAIENSRLYAARSAIARTLQASLLPPALPEVPGFELAAHYHSASEGTEVGGDFYDVFNTAEDQWYAVVGDVCGKGAEAAAVTAMARYTIRAAAVRRRSPAAILRLLERGDAAPGLARARRALLHDRLPAPGPLALAGAGHGRLRRPSAARAPARRRHGRGARRAGHAARARRAPGAARPHRRAARRRHGRALHRRPHRGGRAGPDLGRRGPGARAARRRRRLAAADRRPRGARGARGPARAARRHRRRRAARARG